MTYGVSSGDFIRPYRNVQLRHMPEAPSQTFKIGDPLILNSTSDKGNQIKISGTDPTTGTVVGFAAEAASGVEGTLIPVWVLDLNAEFLVCVEDAKALDNDLVADEYGIIADATNLIWRIDSTETTSKVFRVVALAPGFAHGDVNGKLIVRSAYGGGQIFGS